MNVEVLQAPVMVARALSRRAIHWIVMRHQQHKLKLSLRRRRRRSLLWRNRQELFIQKVLQHRSYNRIPGQQRRLLPAGSPLKMGKHKPLRFRPPVRVPSQRALAKSQHITYRKIPPTQTAAQDARPEERTADEGIYEEIPVPLYRNLHTDLGHVHRPAAARSLRTPERPRIPQVPLKSRERSGTTSPTHSFRNTLAGSSSSGGGGQSLTLHAFISEDSWMTFPRSSRPAIYQNLTVSAGEVDSVENKSRCRGGGNHISIEEWLEWWLEEERKVYSCEKKRVNLTYSDVLERPASFSFEIAGSDKTSDSDVDVNFSLEPRNTEERVTKSKLNNRISKLIQQFENSENDGELDVRLKAAEIRQGGSATFAQIGLNDNSSNTRKLLPPKPSTLPSELQPSRSWSALESRPLDALVSSRLSLPFGHFDGPVQAINPMYISQASEAIVRFRMPSSSRSSAPRSSDSVSSLSSTSISSSGDSSVSSSVMVPLANTTNRRPWIAQDNTHGSTFLRGSSLPVPKNTVPSMRPGYNPSLLGADKGNTRHVPPKASSSATAKYSNAFASPLPSVIPKPPSASLNSNGASDSAAEATGPENFRVKCSVSLGEGEKVLLEQVHIDLMNEPWFHMITRKKAEMCVKNCKDGTFLIRPSTRNTDPLTLCLRYQGRTYNIPIRQRVSDKCFALGREKANELAFETVPLLVEAYHEKPIRLQTGDKTLLKDTPPKIKENVYVKHTASSA